MDTALILKQKVESGVVLNLEQASEYLDNSVLVKKLLTDFNFDFDVLNLLTRLNEISEIPFTPHLKKVQKCTNLLADLSFCTDGFSLTGKSDDILSCYNSMITSVLIRLNYNNQTRINNGIEWILKYQNIERGAMNKWQGSRILKYGGCMKSTTCYIGIVKAIIALSDYKHNIESKTNKSVESKLEQGLAYILDHKIYLRKSNGQAITKDITKLMYPFSYKTNIIEILRLLKTNNLSNDIRCKPAKDYLISRMQNNKFWKANKIYLPKSWILFDTPNKNGFWVSNEIEKIL